MTLAELREQHPEAVAALRAELEQEHAAQAASAADAARAEGASAELERMLSLAACLLGEQSAETLRDLAASGIRPEQAKAMQKAFAALVGKEAQKDSMQDKLDALRSAHDNAPGHPSGRAGTGCRQARIRGAGEGPHGKGGLQPGRGHPQRQHRPILKSTRRGSMPRRREVRDELL